MRYTNKVCVVCETMGCCDSNEQHTYDNTCMVRRVPTPEQVAERDRLKAMYDDNSHDID